MTIPQWIIFIPLSIAAVLALAVVLMIGVTRNGQTHNSQPIIAGLVVGLALGAVFGAVIGYETGDLTLMMLIGAAAGLVIGAGIGGTYQMWLR
jgi:hypothetical protein